MYSGYENWMTSGLDDLQRQALWLVYSAWRQGKPIDQQRAIFQLKREGADVHAAADALAGLINGQPDLALLHRRPGEDHLTPTIAAAIHLRDRAEAAADLEVLEALPVHLHATYDPECTSLPIADLATKLQISQPRLLQVIDLWKGPVQERLGVEPDALFWTSYDRFLRRVIGAPAASRTSAPRDRSAPLPIDVSGRQVRWMNIGPFARATTLGLGAMTFVVGANAAGKTTALVPVYDFKTHRRTDEPRWLDPKPVVIVEGILALVDARLRAELDIKIFVDTDPDIRIFRRIRRDIEQRGRTFESVREQYYRHVRPMHLQFVEPSKRRADLIIPEGGDNRVALDLVVSKLRNIIDRARELR